MDVLILGFSSLVKRRVLPALYGVEGIARIHIASRRPLATDTIRGQRAGHIFTSYEEALTRLDGGLVYVSLPNALHHEWCMRALSTGFHVVVDKPAFLNAIQASEATDLALRKRLCCAEATVWRFHPMMELLARLKREEGGTPLGAFACFSSPALDPGNFRLRRDMGGGVILDRGSYAITCGRTVFNDEPVSVRCAVIETDPKTGLDLSCHIGLDYPGNRSLTGFYSLKSDYRNTLCVVAETYSVDFDRVFTPPEDYCGPALVRREGKSVSVETPRGNTFSHFLTNVITAIKSGDCGSFAKDIVRDAVIGDSIRAAAAGAHSVD